MLWKYILFIWKEGRQREEARKSGYPFTYYMTHNNQTWARLNEVGAVWRQRGLKPNWSLLLGWQKSFYLGQNLYHRVHTSRQAEWEGEPRPGTRHTNMGYGYPYIEGLTAMPNGHSKCQAYQCTLESIW